MKDLVRETAKTFLLAVTSPNLFPGLNIPM